MKMGERGFGAVWVTLGRMMLL